MPSLPLELERHIFEMVALQDINHDNRVRLILVAKRVYEWIRPILYRVAIAQETQGRLTIRNWRNAQITDVAPFVRHLSTYSAAFAIELLSTFHNTENLSIWLGHASGLISEALKKMNDLPIRVLSIMLSNMKLDEAIGYCPALRNITHLELIAVKGTTWDDYKALVEFPNLTHLCFYSLVYMEDDVVPALLKHCPSLRAIIYQLLRQCTIETDDPRFLVIQEFMDPEELIIEWERSANGRIGLWELADIIIEARKDKFSNITPSIFHE